MNKKTTIIIFEIAVLALGLWVLNINLESETVTMRLREYTESDDALSFWYSIIFFSGCLIFIVFDIFKGIYQLFRDKQ